MGTVELIITAIALSMDAFAVAICKGLCTERVRIRHMALTGAWFGGFQALMPLIGFLLGSAFAKFIEPVDHWVAFALLSLLGINMLKEAFSKEDGESCDCSDSSFAFKTMLVMAIATSIDALAVGLTFALYPDVNIVPAISIIGAVTFVICAGGVLIGHKFGAKFKSKAEFCGGLVLIIIGLKLLIEGLLA